MKGVIRLSGGGFNGRWKRRGFTVLELLIVVAIVGIMLTLLLPSIGPIRDRVERVVCTGNLRSVYCALGAYVSDNESWPQCPEESDRAAIEKFWMTTLQDYGTKEETWTCPTLKRAIVLSASKAKDAPKMHYVPTDFDDDPQTPHKWPAMPWVVEIGNMHACGNLLIRSDGVVTTMNEVIRSTGADKATGSSTVLPLK